MPRHSLSRVLAIGSAAVLLVVGCAEPPAWEGAEGGWQTVAEAGDSRFRMALEIEAGTEGASRGRAVLPDQGSLEIALVASADEPGRLLGAAEGLGASLSVWRDGEGVAGELSLAGASYPLRFQRDHPGFRRFEVARVGADGEAVTAYRYQAPAALEDGWPVAPAGEAGLDEAPLVALMGAILAGDYPQVHAILVARGGRLAVEEYFYGYGRERLHTLQSCTKSVTSLLFGIALEEGLLKDLDAPVHGFFPGYAGRRWVDAAYDISLRHALTMSASLAWNESLPYTDPRNDNTAMNASADWIGYVLDRERAGAPGQKFAYTSGLSILLGGVLRQATGRYADEYAAETLFPALGIDSYRWFAAPDGTRHTGGGLSLRPRDFLKIGQLVLDGGAWNGRQVVPAAWIAESTSRQTGEGDTPYGYQWWLGSFDAGGEAVEAIQALGYGGQILSIFPSLDLVVAFTAGDYAGDGARPRERLERYILPAASSSPRQKPR